MNVIDSVIGGKKVTSDEMWMQATRELKELVDAHEASDFPTTSDCARRYLDRYVQLMGGWDALLTFSVEMNIDTDNDSDWCALEDSSVSLHIKCTDVSSRFHLGDLNANREVHRSTELLSDEDLVD